MALQNVVLFEGEDTVGGANLWVTDGTASGTSELLTNPPIVPGQAAITGGAIYGFASSTRVSLDLTVFDNHVLFAGRFSPTVPVKYGPYTLWTTDGTVAGTVPIPLASISGANPNGLLIGNPMTGAAGAMTPGFTVFGDEVLFRGRDTGGAFGLWMTNGTATGTKEITGINGTAATGINPTDMTVFNGKVLFNGANAAGHLGLWTTDGTAGGTKELIPPAGAGAAATGLNPTDMTIFGGKVLFDGVDANGLSGLWATDGTAGGTHELLAEAAGASSGLNPTDMTVFGSKVLFSGVDANGLSGLWVTDGTANGTHEVLAEAAGATAATDPHGLSPNDLTVFNGEVFFNGLDQFGLQELWVTNGTAAGTKQLVTTGFPGRASFQPSSLEVYNGQLLFSAMDTGRLLERLVDDGRHGRRDEGNNPQFGGLVVRTRSCGSDCAGAGNCGGSDHCRNGGLADDDIGGSDPAIRACDDWRRERRRNRHTEDYSRRHGRQAERNRTDARRRRGGLHAVRNRGRDHQRTRRAHLHADRGCTKHDLDDHVHAA